MGRGSRQCTEPAKLRGFKCDGVAGSLSIHLQVLSDITLTTSVLFKSSLHIRMLFRLEKHGRQDIIKLNYSQTAVSNFVASVQLDLHRTGRAVSYAAVINRVCEELGVKKYSEFGLGPPRQLPRLRRLSELESRLLTYVTTYAANRYNLHPAKRSVSTFACCTLQALSIAVCLQNDCDTV